MNITSLSAIPNDFHDLQTDGFISTNTETPISIAVSEECVEGPISVPRANNFFGAVEMNALAQDISIYQMIEFSGEIDELKNVIKGRLIVQQYKDDQLLYEHQADIHATKIMHSKHDQTDGYIGHAVGTKRYRPWLDLYQTVQRQNIRLVQSR